MRNRNSVLLRTFIEEVQKTGEFNHLAMMEILRQRQQKNNTSQIKQEEDLTKPSNIIDFEDKKKSDKHNPDLTINSEITPSYPSSQGNQPRQSSNFYPQNGQFSPPIFFPQERGVNYPFISPFPFHYSSFPHQYHPFSGASSSSVATEISEFSPANQTFLNPSNLPLFNPAEKTGNSDNKNKQQTPILNTQEKIETNQELHLPRKTNRDKIIFQKYIEYVRKTGDCEYPPLEKYLVKMGLIKKSS